MNLLAYIDMDIEYLQTYYRVNERQTHFAVLICENPVVKIKVCLQNTPDYFRMRLQMYKRKLKLHLGKVRTVY